ncbi:NAD(P)-binding protein [Conexibacter sp. CPCC 206217]|uniref:NAD(P)-binding protein n=1 Tax=Conexibacter sp. CPCC 206217 TaxID=3064574 RepID=UPI00272835F9|nr:NAD(P)-binding protein [Conexibacter sp. CPCC 206217]MDO8211144.1 NAD(P)-binding protein [Conexibacter sp. CPCC 206217]
MSEAAQLRAAVIGAGPSGFYACGALLQAGFAVDLFDALPTPFGLIRSGVAPDHPKIKLVTRVFDKTAKRDGFRFFGGVEIGVDVAVAELRARYDAVLHAVGTPHDNQLGIPGEDARGSVASSAFVSWYNGHPTHADTSLDLDVERAVVIGNGNVALDVARMLVLDPDELRTTDVADHALDAFAGSRVRDVTVLGRRGPAQAAFTTPELAELGRLSRADVSADAAQLPLDAASAAAVEADPELQVRIELLREYAARAPSGASHNVALRFLRSPREILLGEDGRVTGVRVAVNRLELQPDGRLAARPSGEEETIPCGLVVRAVGYRGRALPGVPFDDERGLIPNAGGRVLEDDAIRVGEYVTGWVKRGPSGVIGTNKQCALETVAAIVADRDAGLLARGDGSADASDPAAADASDAALEAWLEERCGHAVAWSGWDAIDAHEQAAGEPHGRPRVKLVDLDRMHAVVRGG